MNAFVVVAAELYKQKRGVMWLLVIGGPLLVLGLDFFDLYLRYDYLFSRYRSEMTSWEILLRENHFFWFFFLPIGITLVSTVIHFREFSDNAWKQLLSLPVRRANVYLSKWFLTVLLSWFAITVAGMGMVLVGKAIGFPEAADYSLFFAYIMNQYAAILGIVSIQHWLSSRCKNVIIPVAIGICGSVCALFFAQSGIGPYIPYSSLVFTAPLAGEDTQPVVWGGLITGIVALFAGMIEFQKRDIV
ncbi:ABC transporter permease [Aneurinibacillus tyrosinisolvens]|uniref:ABC transporter permease n=1 Tax=Aneurinibacillus tyrosinisolvens TaxID=1443435 RepID=UPI00063F5AC2|nr:ABC transporter permease [Aneurinibacillus tyrosinisolvens]